MIDDIRRRFAQGRPVRESAATLQPLGHCRHALRLGGNVVACLKEEGRLGASGLIQLALGVLAPFRIGPGAKLP